MATIVNNDVIDTLKDRYLTFPMAGRTMALEVEFVTEIIDSQDITYVPMVPSYLEGVINLRGKVIPLINFYKLFEIDESKREENRCMAIIEYKDISISVMVERVNEVLEIKPDKIISGSVEKNEEDNSNAEAVVWDGNDTDEDKNIAEFVKAVAELDDYQCLIVDIDKLIAMRK